MEPSDTTLLIIDDEEKLVFGLKMILMREGYHVITAKNGEEGLQKAHLSAPDLIICDVMMPPPNGFMIKNILAQDPDLRLTPFIFLTARTAEGDRIAGLNIGADDYICKPFNVDELLARVKAVLRRDRAGREIGRQSGEAAIENLRYAIATNIGHELRTPLGVILNTLDLAIHEKSHNIQANINWYLDAALMSAHRLRVLVDDLIALNAIDTDHLPKFRQQIDMRFDFLEPINRVFTYWESKCIQHNISIQSGICINSAKSEFIQAVTHLVDNAYKFSPTGGKVDILLLRNGSGGCELIVADQGPGIPVELREKVFERYYQISQGNSRDHDGLGVGLTIARAFAENLGGSVTVVDSPVGCKVKMILPPGPVDWIPVMQSQDKENVNTEISAD